LSICVLLSTGGCRLCLQPPTERLHFAILPFCHVPCATILPFCHVPCATKMAPSIKLKDLLGSLKTSVFMLLSAQSRLFQLTLPQWRCFPGLTNGSRLFCVGQARQLALGLSIFHCPRCSVLHSFPTASSFWMEENALMNVIPRRS